MANSLNKDITKGEEVSVSGESFICKGGFGMKKDHPKNTIMGHKPNSEDVHYISGLNIDIPTEKPVQPEKPKRSHKKKPPMNQKEESSEMILDVPYNSR